MLTERGALRPDLTVEAAADLAFLIASAENYMLATTTLGWTPDRWRGSTAAQLAAALLRAEADPENHTAPH